ncbi:MAG: CpcT/CpeT family chromophore lyase [Gammaproteobacteria bacterium]|nr:CpcT/CpeT family chromophore lyase [Gammaproteobacteria bacterium]
MRRLLCILMAFTPLTVFGQGMDSTAAERSLLIMAEMLPGVYDNANQAYFDQRRGLEQEDRHARVKTTIAKVDAPAFGNYVYLWTNETTTADGKKSSYRLATLSADGNPDEVTMRHYFRMDGEITSDDLATLKPADLRRTGGCDYFFKRRAEHFRGTQREKACQFEWDGANVYTANTIELSDYDLWFVDHKYKADTGERITGVASGEPYWLERARIFHCYADIPGVAGGRDIPFERYDDMVIHDRGGIHWFETRDEEPRTLGLTLRRVTWHVNNESNGNFNRDSLVIYALEKMADGSVKSHSYSFTEPTAERLGMNMQWMLVNCTMTKRNEAQPRLH